MFLTQYGLKKLLCCQMEVKASDNLFELRSCHELYLLRLFRPAQVFMFLNSRVQHELTQVFSLVNSLPSSYKCSVKVILSCGLSPRTFYLHTNQASSSTMYGQTRFFLAIWCNVRIYLFVCGICKLVFSIRQFN